MWRHSDNNIKQDTIQLTPTHSLRPATQYLKGQFKVIVWAMIGADRDLLPWLEREQCAASPQLLSS